MSASTGFAWGVGRRASEALRIAIGTALEERRGRRAPDAERGAGALLDGLGSMRGLPVKLAQLAHELPELGSPAIRAQLARAFDDAPPAPWGVMERQLRIELGPDWRGAFASFDEAPFAAASLGQVHAARLADGTDVVVKIQYPGLAADVAIDIATLRGGMRMVSWARPHLVVADELMARLAEELDYRHEARALSWFRPRLAPLGVDVPAPVAATSRARVLTMTRVRGTPMIRWATSGATAAAKERAAVALLRAWAACVTTLGRIHGDPGPGNLLVTDEGALGWVDFGCVRELSLPTRKLVGTLLREPDAAGDGRLLPCFLELGVLGAGEAADLYASTLAPLERWFAGPREGEAIDFAHRGADWTREGQEHLVRLVRTRGPRVHPEFVLVFRATLALFGMLQRLGARVPAGALDDDLPPEARS